MHQTASTDGSANAAFRSAARSSSVPARYFVFLPAFGIIFGTRPSDGDHLGRDLVRLELVGRRGGRISATVSPFFIALGKSGSGGFSA